MKISHDEHRRLSRCSATVGGTTHARDLAAARASTQRFWYQFCTDFLRFPTFTRSSRFTHHFDPASLSLPSLPSLPLLSPLSLLSLLSLPLLPLPLVSVVDEGGR